MLTTDVAAAILVAVESSASDVSRETAQAVPTRAYEGSEASPVAAELRVPVPRAPRLPEVLVVVAVPPSAAQSPLLRYWRNRAGSRMA